MSVRQVEEGVVLKCTLGSCCSNLLVPKFHYSTLGGKNIANISDHVGNVNIMPFGSCARAIPKPVCSPNVPMKWINGQKTMKIDNEHVLLSESIVACVYGGIISIEI